jgi:hypothetical protein
LNRGNLYLGYQLQDQRIRYYRELDALADDALDRTDLVGGSAFASLENNRLDEKMYPSRGNYFYLSARFNHVSERFGFGDSTGYQFTKLHRWLQLRMKFAQYLRAGSRTSLGLTLEGAASTLGVLENARSTVLTSPRYTPFQDSPVLFHPEHFSRYFAAAGLILQIDLAKKLSLRAEGHLMQSFSSLTRNEETNALEQTLGIEDRHIMASLCLFYRTRVRPIGVLALLPAAPPLPHSGAREYMILIAACISS